MRGKDKESERESERKKRAEMRRPNVPAVEQVTEATAGRRLSESPPEEPLLFLSGKRRPEGTTTHILLLLCWGRREGWRNNLDGLGLIKEKERETRQKRHTL